MAIRSFERPSSRILAIALALGALSPAARAATPHVVGHPLVRNPSFNGTVNSMMYTVSVSVDSTGVDPGHAGIVGYVSDDDYTTCSDTATSWKWSHTQQFDTTATRTWTLYNFVPGTLYHYKVLLGDPSGVTRVKCGTLQTPAVPTPKLPTNLGYLNLQYQTGGALHPAETKYVLLETDDCGTGGAANPTKYYLVVIDVENQTIVWYLDVAALSNDPGAVGSGLHYEPGATPAEDRIHITSGRDYLYEWAFDGSQNHVYDFGSDGQCSGETDSLGPCIHHDVVRSDVTGNTYAIAAQMSDVDSTGTAWDLKCDTTSRFLDEGYLVLDSTWSLVDQEFLMADVGYDPTVDAGPSDTILAGLGGSCDSRHWSGTYDPALGVLDWTHENALAVSSFDGDEVIDVSLKEWDQVIRFDAATGDRLWSLSSHAAYTDWGPIKLAAGVAGPATFDGQHDVNAIASNTLMMVDNRGGTTGSRLLEIALSDHPLGATIEKSWAVVDGSGAPIRCPIEGTAQRVPGSTDDHVLTVCGDDYSIVEMDDPTGASGTAPPLYIWLPDGTTDDICTSGGPAVRTSMQGWHKAYPLANVGEF